MATTADKEDARLTSLADVFTSLKLPCGRTLPNRLVKVALYEHMASFGGGPPNSNHLSLYAHWSRGQWGMIFTGNVQVVADHLTLARDLVVPEVLTEDAIQPYMRLASAIHHGTDRPLVGFSAREKDAGRPLAIMQLSHAGKQSPNFLGGRFPFVPPLAPSAIPMELSGGFGQERTSIGQMLSQALSGILHRLVFLTPREMTQGDIDHVVDAFVKGAQLAAKSDFDGIEIHAAHGYLLAQFISPKTNVRTDEFSASLNPLRLVWKVASAIRECSDIPSDFVVGIKLNAADYLGSSITSEGSEHGSDEQRVLAHVREIASWKMVDFIEVSGGTYENPNFMDVSSTSRRQALFSRFSHCALVELSDCGDERPMILLTGGLTSLTLLGTVLEEKHGDLLGVGRLSILQPEMPRLLKNALSSGKMAYVDELESGPLANGKVSHEILSGLPQPGWTTKVERTFTRLLYFLWELIPPIARPQFPKLIGAGAEMAWYDVAMRNIATGSQADIGDGLGAVMRLWLYVAPGPESIGNWAIWATFSAIAVLALSYLKVCRHAS